MNDRELNEKLKVAREEADKFFQGWRFGPYKKMVYRRLDSYDYSRRRGGLNRSNSILAFGKKAALACLLVFLAALSLFNFFPFKQSQGTGIPISQQPVMLGENNNAKWVSFFRLDKPDSSRHSLLAIIWDSDPDGDYRMVYSSILEDCDIPHPVSVMDFPGDSGKLLLISSSNKNRQYLHYRLLEYDYSNRTFITYMEQDFVPFGKVDFREGILVEERTVPEVPPVPKKSSSNSERKRLVNRFIPYKVNSQGALVLPTDYIRLNRGDYLTFVGYDTGFQLKVNFSGGILEDTGGEGLYLSGINCTPFYAANSGKGLVRLKTREEKGPGRALVVEVE